MADLVQRLRDYPSYEECLQAADRIEALEAALRGIVILAGPHRDVERLMERLIPSLVEHDNAMGDLAKGVVEMCDIARRALEGKP